MKYASGLENNSYETEATYDQVLSHFSYKKVISINADEKTVFALGQNDIEDKAYTYERLVLDPESSP